jgi:hypothetical protein
VGERVGEGDADAAGEWHEQTVGEPRDHVLLVDQDRHTLKRGGR